MADRRIAGGSIPSTLRLLFWLARTLVLNNVRKADRRASLQVDPTAAAPISPDLLRWYLALGIEMIEAYGLTECSGAASANPIGRPRTGTVGASVPFGDLALSPEGEILIRGDHVFMGYLNLPEKTGETIVDGWLHTGDVGRSTTTATCASPIA